MYRIFGNPCALSTHQAAIYLRYKRVPCTLHVANFMSTRFMGWWYGVDSFFCNLSPQGKTLHTFLDLIEDVEGRGMTEEKNGGALWTPPRVEESAVFSIVHWALVAYANWWLMLTCGGLRWVHGEGSTGMVRHCGYFLLIPVGPIAQGMARTSRDHMRKVLQPYGLVRDTVDYMGDHLVELLEKMETHLATYPYLLGHRATLVDVMFASAFSSHFTQDDPPSSSVAKYHKVMSWVERMLTSPVESDSSPCPPPASILPLTVRPMVELTSHVLPCLAAQCDAFAGTVMEFSRPEVEYGGRTVPTPWTLRLPDTSLSSPCEVSLPHVQVAQYCAQKCTSQLSGATLPSEMAQWHGLQRIIDTMRSISESTKGFRVECRSKGMAEIFVVTKTN